MKTKVTITDEAYTMEITAETVGEQRILDLFVMNKDAESHFERESEVTIKASYIGHVTNDRAEKLVITVDAKEKGN